MYYKELLQQIKEFLSACEQMRYGEYVGATWPYNHDGPMVYTEPDAVLLGLASNAITDLLARAEAAEARVHELETLHRTEMCESGYDCVELGKVRKELEEAEARAEKAEKERDAAIHGIFQAASAKCFWCKHESNKWLSDGSMDDLCRTCLENGKCNWEWKGQKE